MAKSLLVIAEEGGYPDFCDLYRDAGCEVRIAMTLRKGISEIKRLAPTVVVTEFCYKPIYGTQISNLETVFAAIQRCATPIRLIVFYEKPDSAHLDSLAPRFPGLIGLPFPISEKALKAHLDFETSLSPTICP